MLVTNLESGDTLGVGGACVVAWLRGTADIMDPPTKPKRSIDPPAADTGDDGESGRSSARRPRGKAHRPTVVSGGADDQGAATTPDNAAAD